MGKKGNEKTAPMAPEDKKKGKKAAEEAAKKEAEKTAAEKNIGRGKK